MVDELIRKWKPHSAIVPTVGRTVLWLRTRNYAKRHKYVRKKQGRGTWNTHAWTIDRYLPGAQVASKSSTDDWHAMCAAVWCTIVKVTDKRICVSVNSRRDTLAWFSRKRFVIAGELPRWYPSGKEDALKRATFRDLTRLQAVDVDSLLSIGDHFDDFARIVHGAHEVAFRTVDANIPRLIASYVSEELIDVEPGYLESWLDSFVKTI